MEARLDQIKEINEFIIEQYNEGRINYNDRLILLGDFNVDASNFKKKIEVYNLYPYSIIIYYIRIIINHIDVFVVPFFTNKSII